MRETETSPSRPLRAILMPTCRKYGRYIDGCVEAMDAMWPGHPDLWVITDKAEFDYARRIEVPVREWVSLVASALDRLISERRLDLHDRVLLVIEDHVAVDLVPSERIDEAAKLAGAHDLKFLSFDGDFGRFRARVAHRAGSLEVCELAPEFLYYSSLHPGIWEVEHLCKLLAQAQSNNLLDPWNFERLRIDGVPHFTTDRLWPSHFGGFLKDGWVDIRIVLAMRRSGLRRLQLALLRDWAMQQPAYCTMRLRRFSHRFRRK